MAVSASFQTHVVEQLRRAGTTVKAKRMFGGVGIYDGDLFFALISDDTLYFKVDATTRPRYDARGMTPFRPFGDERMTMQYYTIPEELLDEPDALREWAVEAIGVARHARAGSKKRR